MMAAYHTQATELDSSHNTSSASLVPSVPYPSAQHWAQLPSPLPLAQPAYELIQHRVFVGGFPSATNENELRTFFEKYGHIREAKVIRTTEGSSKGYGFVTFDSEEEAQTVRNLSPDKLEFKGRRLNLGPAMRRITHNARFTDFAMACPTPVLACNASPTFGGYYQPAHPQTPTYVLVQPNGQVPSFVYSPVSPQHQLQQQAGARYVAQNGSPLASNAPQKQQSVERANESVDENRGQSSPKQQTLQLPQTYYTSQPMTPMTPSMQQQSFRHLHQMQNFVTAQGSPYAHQQAVPYYAAPTPTDMTHYSQMAMPAACYYAPPAARTEQQPQVQQHYANYYDQQEQEQRRSSMWMERSKTDPNKTLSPVCVTPPASSKMRNADDDEKTPKAKPMKRLEPRQLVKDCPADPLTPEKQHLQLGGRLNRLRPAPVRYYRVPFDGNRGKSVSLPSSPAAFLPPKSPAGDSPVAAAAMARAGQQASTRSPRKSVVSLASQMSQVQIHGSPNNHCSVNNGYGAQQATTPTGVTRKVALASGATAQLCEGAVVPNCMLNSASLNKTDARVQQY